MEQFTASSAGINKDIAAGSHRHTSFDPEKRAVQEIAGFKAEVQSMYEELSESAKSEAQKTYLNEQMSVLQGNYAHKYNDYLATKGRTFSVMITGGSGFNNRAHDKANRAEQNRYDDMQEFKHRATAAILRELKKMAVEEAGGELVILEAKIKSLEENQILMVAGNKIIRNAKITEEQRIKALLELGLSKAIVDEMLQPKRFGGNGYRHFELSNNNANIHSAKKRLEEIQAKEATPTSDITFAGGQIVDNAELDRIQIVYAEIPNEATRAKLKESGWKWSHKNSAWQRMRTDNSRASAKRITGAV
ncbi:MAG: hypothetical protein Q8M94_12640 [Ignavibacteria bacterium]|nr:hypothetical protein [Ignavibacteria bacterium]